MTEKEEKGIAKELGNEFEIGQYIQALASSSSRVRFVMLAIIIAIIAAASTLWSEQKGSWERARVKRLFESNMKADVNNIWKDKLFYDDKCKPREELAEPFLPKLRTLIFETKVSADASEAYGNLSAENKCDVVRRFRRLGIASKENANAYAEKLYEAYVNNMLYVRVPVLGILFDVNDLGLITGVTFFVLMLVMSFYTHRAHENLSLCMWKVRELAEKEKCFDLPGSKPNLLYHALAMQQVFTIPPTLARWRNNWVFRRAHYSLFLLPFLTQLAVMMNDVNTAQIGSDYSAIQTRLSLQIQVALLIAVFFFCLLCWSHLHADDVLWERIFLFINPGHRFKAKARWIFWSHFAENRIPGWGIAVTNYGLFITDTVRDIIWRVTQNELLHYKSLHAKGLYLNSEGLCYYSLSSGNARSFKGGIRRLQWLKTPISWSEGDRDPDPHSEIINGLVDKNDLLQVWKRRMKRTHPTNLSTWDLGGAKHQGDGAGDDAGFDSIQAVIHDGTSLLVTDGAWLRCINEKGTMTTWGGKPLAEVVRRESPFLLGMALTGGKVITPEGNHIKRDFKPKVLVCDFSTRRILAVTDEAAEEVYRSRFNWAPSGIFVHKDDIYLLEYKRGFVWNELVTSSQARNKLWFFAPLYLFRSYLRVLRFSSLSFRESPAVLCRISPIKAFWAKKKARRINPKRCETKCIKNSDNWQWPKV
ncbi:MAG TPA: hypothetical protein VGH73_23240 [Thermoanaerobaculia bacterium]|jgi:hypothetical protein